MADRGSAERRYHFLIQCTDLRNFDASSPLKTQKRGMMHEYRMSNRAALAAAEPCVLLVEDEFLIRTAVADSLRDAGFHVIEACNADEAVTLLDAADDVDLVFTDVRMPGTLDGLGLLAFRQRTRPRLPVVVTSGHLVPHQATEKGAVCFVVKPYLLEDIATTLQSVLGDIR